MNERNHIDEHWFKKAAAGSVPVHIGIIMDGNGRWAQKQGLKRYEGHRAGVESIRRCIPAVIRLGIKHCTLFVFSTENWKRPQEEIRLLFALLVDYAQRHKLELVEKGVRVIPIGRQRGLPVPVARSLETLAKDTNEGRKLALYLAVNYGGRQEIFDAALEFANKLKASDGPFCDAPTMKDFADCLYTPGVPDPDLIIRTSGEQRISNFLLWQSAYSELVFSEKFWPDFGPVDIYKAIVEYSSRSRRFGDVPKKRG